LTLLTFLASITFENDLVYVIIVYNLLCWDYVDFKNNLACLTTYLDTYLYPIKIYLF